jgi:hypothetical protein
MSVMKIAQCHGFVVVSRAALEHKSLAHAGLIIDLEETKLRPGIEIEREERVPKRVDEYHYRVAYADQPFATLRRKIVKR